MRDRILYAITGHGYGHATRAVAVALALRRRFPGLDITFSTGVSREFLARSGVGLLPMAQEDAGTEGFAYRAHDYEPGTREKICFEVDVEATREAYRVFGAEHERRVAEEAHHLLSRGYRGVVSDIAAVPIAAAARAGIPAVAISNFTWDWILAPHLESDPDLAPVVGQIREDYRPAEVYLRLPFHPASHPFRAVRDVPLVARRSALPAREVRRRLGLDSGSARPLILVTVGGLGAKGWPAVRVPGLNDVQFVVVGPLPLEFPDTKRLVLGEELGAGLGFADLVAAADLVVTKPGYGICSECAAHGTPMAGVERRGFREYEPLREGMMSLLPYREIRLEEFLAGSWEPAIRALLGAGRGTPVPSGGDESTAGEAALALGL